MKGNYGKNISGKRYVACAGVGDWVLNLRATGEAVLTRGRRSETVSARELLPREAALVLREEVKHGYPFARNFGVTADSSLEEFERAVVGHPLFALDMQSTEEPGKGDQSVAKKAFSVPPSTGQR